MPSGINIGNNAVLIAQELGVADRATLEDMVMRAARITHSNGNYRFKDYVFDIFDRQLIGLSKYSDGVEKKKSIYKCDDCKDDGGFCLSCGVGL